MLHYDRTDISEGIDLAKSSGSKECMACHNWFFKHGFKYQDSVCNGCPNLLMHCVNISDIAIITVKVLIFVVLFIALTSLTQLIH